MKLKYFAALGALAFLPFSGCEKYRKIETETVVEQTTKKNEIKEDPYNLEGVVIDEVFGYPNMTRLGDNFQVNVPYVLKVDTKKGLYTIEITISNSSKPIAALAAAIDKGDRVRFKNFNNWQAFFYEDKIGWCKSDYITLLEKGKQEEIKSSYSAPAEAPEKK